MYNVQSLLLVLHNWEGTGVQTEYYARQQINLF